jgi:hypothetical protein
MYLLSTGITIDYAELPLAHLLVLAAAVFAALIALTALVTSGVSFKWGDKEVAIGGIKRLLAKKDEDTRLKERLKRFSDEVDEDTSACIFDLVDDMGSRLERTAMSMGDHCVFTAGEFVRLAQEELKRRVRRNNLKKRLAEESREAYVEKILRDVRERYAAFQYKAARVKCGDSYPDFAALEQTVKDEIGGFADGAVDLLVGGMKRKIARYKEARGEFNTAEARKFCCDDCIAKNLVYIKNLTGKNYKPSEGRNDGTD